MAHRKHLTLKEARDAKGWTQQQLEAETQRADPNGVGVNQRTISGIERGDAADPMNSTVVLLETALRLQRGTLVFGKQAEALSA